MPADLRSERPPACRSGGRVGAARSFAVVFAVALAGSGCGFGGDDEGDILTYDVTRGDLVISFTERGNVKSGKSVPIFVRLEGRSTIVSIVPEGSSVEEGDVLVELDASELTQHLNQQEISVENAEATLLQAREQTKIQQSLSDSLVRAAEVELEQAKLSLSKYVEGDHKLSLRQARADVAISEEELVRAQNKFDWTEKLAKKGYVTGTELIADRLAVHRAELDKEQAVHALSVLNEYTHRKDLMLYTFAVEQADDALDRAKTKRGAEMSKVQADESVKGRTLGLNRTRLEKIQDQLSKTTILAPQPGMVVYHMEHWRRERVIEQGADVHENQLLMNLPDVSTMAVELKVHEAWIDQVRSGLPALISIDAMPHLNLKGTITKVGLLPDHVNRWLNPDLKVYETMVTISDAEGVDLLKPGMSAKVQVIITVLRDVLHVPVQSVTTIDGEPVCYVREGGAFVSKKVETGKYNEAFIEIVSGLSAGDVVQLIAPEPTGSVNGEDDFREAESLVRESEKQRPEKSGEDDAEGKPERGEKRSASGRPEPAAFRAKDAGGGRGSGSKRPPKGGGGRRGGRPPKRGGASS